MNKKSNYKKKRKRFKKIKYKPIIIFIGLSFLAFFLFSFIFRNLNSETTIQNMTAIESIDISQIIIHRNDINMTYKFYYENSELDINRHRFIDNENLIQLITFDPLYNILSVNTSIPSYFYIFYSYDSQNVYIEIINPRDIYSNIVMIDPGHGGSDSGAIVGEIFESHIVLEVSLIIYQLFSQSDSGIRAFLIRDSDVFVENLSRIELANSFADIFVSVHANSYTGPSAYFVYGTEVLYSTNQENSRNLSQILQNELVLELETRDRGLWTRNDISVLAASIIPSALVEIEFMTSPNSLYNLTNPNFQYRAASAIYRGIVYAFNNIFDNNNGVSD